MPQFDDDLFLGPVPGNVLGGSNPSPMTRGAGPMARIFFFNLLPVTLDPACLFALARPAASGAVTFIGTSGANVTVGTNAAGTTTYTLDCARTIDVVCTGDETLNTLTITGLDYRGQAMSEAITGTNGTTAHGKKAFKTILTGSWATRPANTVSIGVGDTFGFPYAVVDAAYVVSHQWAQTLAADAGTFTAAVTTDPATTTTGDVRGTYKPSSASNGTRRLGMALHLPALGVGPNATTVGLYGVTQA